VFVMFKETVTRRKKFLRPQW